MPLIGNVISTVFAEGRGRNGAGSSDSGSNSKGMELSSPLRVVAAYEILLSSRRGIRNVELQPAPRIRTWTGSSLFMDIEAVLCLFSFVFWQCLRCVRPLMVRWVEAQLVGVWGMQDAN